MLIETIARRFAEWVLGHRMLTIVACVLSFAAVTVGATRLQFSTDYTIFFAEDDPERLAFERMEKVFSKTDNIVFVVAPREGDIFTAQALGAIQELTEAAWKLPYASRVDSVANFQHSYAEGEDIVVEDLVFAPAADLQPADIDRIRRAAFDHPIIVGSLLAVDGNAAGIAVTLRLPQQDPGEVTEASEAARNLANEIQAHHPELEIRVSGMALMNDAFMEASLQDMSIIIPVMYAVMIVVMAVLLRSFVATATISAVMVFSTGVTIGIAGWLGYPLTPPSAAAPTVVLTLAIADGVHLFASIRSMMGEGASKRDAIVESMAVNARPVLLTSVTTMVGFACLNFAEAAPYWHLANMTAAGVGAAYIYSITFLPAVLSLCPIRGDRRAATESSIMVRLAEFTIRRRVAVMVYAAVVSVVFGGFALGLRSNDRFVEYFDESISFRADTEFMLEHMGGIYTVEFEVGAGEDGGVSEPVYLERLAAFAAWLREQPEVNHVYALSDIVKRVNMNTHQDDRAFYRVAESRELNGQLLMLYEMALPFGLDLNDRIDIGKSASRVTVTTSDLSSTEMRALTERAEAWLRSNAPEMMWADATSPVVIFSYLSERNNRSMMWGNATSLALIALCLVVAFGSVRLGLISIIPNVVPIVVGYGMWAALFQEIDVVASLAGTVCLGIIVDDSIHMISKYRTLRRKPGTSGPDALRGTFASSGVAMVVTTAILSCGFGVLTLSGFQMNSHLGLLVVLVVLVALAADLLLLPALLLTFSGDKR